MGSELLHLNKSNWNGARLGLIEELEAHLHPQAQMQVIEALQKEKSIQLILTTHSPNLTSKVKLENIILCDKLNAFPLGKTYTKLQEEDYLFLERFLDTTKANLFFAKGVLLVEGWAEEILIPALARKIKSCQLINKDLTESGVSIVNVGNLAFLRYSKIFLRNCDKSKISIPVSVITDIDLPEYEKIKNKDEYIYSAKAISEDSRNLKILDLRNKFESQNVKAFIAPRWTLEFALLQSKSLSTHFQRIVKTIHPRINENEFEHEIAIKLLNGSLNKTEIAYRLAMLIDEDTYSNNPEINLEDDETDSISYLIEAIKYVSRN
jgi:putative ATP-dependent endonuclease of OLD family